MPNNKKVILDWSETGKTVYCIVVREADGYRLNDVDGGFASNPADPFVLLSEHSVIKGRYSLSESRTVWNDGEYTSAIYRQSGGSPVPASDTLIGTGAMYIVSDTEVTLDYIREKALELREGNILRQFNFAAQQYPARNVEVGRLNSITVKVKADSAADWTSPISTKTLYCWYQSMGDTNPIKVGETE